MSYLYNLDDINEPMTCSPMLKVLHLIQYTTILYHEWGKEEQLHLIAVVMKAYQSTQPQVSLLTSIVLFWKISSTQHGGNMVYGLTFIGGLWIASYIKVFCEHAFDWWNCRYSPTDLYTLGRIHERGKTGLFLLKSVIFD